MFYSLIFSILVATISGILVDLFHDFKKEKYLSNVLIKLCLLFAF